VAKHVGHLNRNSLAETLMDLAINILRQMVRWYVRNAPIEKGKVRIVKAARMLNRHNRTNKLLAEVNPGMWMELDLNSYIERRIFYFGFYRPWVLPYFDRLLAKGRTVVDVGANVGQFTLWAAKRVGTEGMVVAFEPDRSSFEKLVKNVHLNSLQGIFLENIALSNYDGEAILHLNDEHDDNQGQGSLSRLTHHCRTQTVMCMQLDNFVKKEGIKKVHILKVDAQGAEFRILKGAVNLIEKDRPVVIVRCHEEKCRAMGDSTVAVQEFFVDRGYDLFEIHWRKGLIGVTSSRPVGDATFLASSRHQ